MADEDPLSWLLELDAKLDGAKEMLESLKANDDALKGLDRALKKTEESTKKTGDEHEKHGKKAKTLANELKHLNDKLMALTAFQVFEFGFEHALELAKELAAEVIHIGKEAVNAAAHEERLTKSFKLQLGDHEGGEVLEYLDKLGAKTEFIDDETKRFGQDLLKAGFHANQIPHAMAAIADLAGMSSDRMGGAAAAMESLSRIQRSGKVMERSLAPFGIGEDKLIDVLKRRGQKGDTASLKKALQEGTLDREEILQSVYQAITEKTGKKLGGVGEEMGQLLEARLRRMGNLPEMYFEKWSTSPGFQVFSDRIEQLFQKLDPESPDGKRIFSSLEYALDSMTGVIEKLLTPEGLDAFVSGLKSAIDSVGSIIRGLQEMIDLLNGETLSKWSFGGKNANDKQVNQTEEFARSKLATDSGKDDLRRMLTRMSESERQDLVGAGKARGIDYAQYLPKTANTKAESNIGKSMDATAGDLTLADPGAPDLAHEAGQKVAAAHLEGVRTGLDMHSPSRKLLALGRLAADSFADGVEDSAGNVSDSFDVALPAMAGQTTSAGGGGFGGVQISIPINVVIEGGGGDSAEALARRIEEIVPSALQSALEQLRAELGA